MTTNYRDRLDDALIRPGRVDFQQFFGNANTEQMAMLFRRFYPDHDPYHFIKDIPENVISMANIQGHFLKYADHPDHAIENKHELQE